MTTHLLLFRARTPFRRFAIDRRIPLFVGASIGMMLVTIGCKHESQTQTASNIPAETSSVSNTLVVEGGTGRELPPVGTELHLYAIDRAARQALGKVTIGAKDSVFSVTIGEKQEAQFLPSGTKVRIEAYWSDATSHQATNVVVKVLSGVHEGRNLVVLPFYIDQPAFRHEFVVLSIKDGAKSVVDLLQRMKFTDEPKPNPDIEAIRKQMDTRMNYFREKGFRESDLANAKEQFALAVRGWVATTAQTAPHTLEQNTNFTTGLKKIWEAFPPPEEQKPDTDSQVTSLLLAVLEGNLPKVEQLLNDGVSPNATTEEVKGTPLQLAIRSGHLSIVKALVNKGADVDRRTVMAPFEVPVSPLTEAAFKGKSNIVEFLLEHGANPNDSADGKFSASLGMAIVEKDNEIAQLIRNAGGKE